MIWIAVIFFLGGDIEKQSPWAERMPNKSICEQYVSAINKDRYAVGKCIRIDIPDKKQP